MKWKIINAIVTKQVILEDLNDLILEEKERKAEILIEAESNFGYVMFSRKSGIVFQSTGKKDIDIWKKAKKEHLVNWKEESVGFLISNKYQKFFEKYMEIWEKEEFKKGKNNQLQDKILEIAKKEK